MENPNPAGIFGRTEKEGFQKKINVKKQQNFGNQKVNAESLF